MNSFEVVLVAIAAAMVVLNIVCITVIVNLRKRVPKHITNRYRVDVESPKVFTHEEMSIIARSAKADLAQVVHSATKELKDMLSTTTQTIDRSVRELALETLQKEAEAYKNGLSELRQKTLEEFSAERESFSKDKQRQLSELEDFLKEQKEKELERFFSRLNDVVSSYLADSLDQRVDFGAQLDYVIASLEENKDAIKKDILA